MATKLKAKTTLEIRLGIYISLTTIVLATVLILTLIETAPFLMAPITEMPSVISMDSSNSVSLTWTAPGDDANVGTATAYDIRYSTSEINDGNWNSTTQVENEPSPDLAGNQQSLVVTNLAPNTKYYFAVKTVDEAGNWSSLSNIADKTTDCFEAWSCTDWSDCIEGQKTRECTDLNNCGTQEEMPAITQSCQPPGDPEEPCTEDWSCTEWSACIDFQQTRECTDTNQCDTTEYKPGESRECDAVGGSEDPIEITYRETYIVTGTNQGGGPQVRLFDGDGNLQSQFWAFEEGFRGGIDVEAEDLGQDGIDEIIVGAGPGYQPAVRIFDSGGNLIDSFMAYDANFRGGVNVAAGDLDGDGQAEIVTVPFSSGGSNVRIFGWRDNQWVPVIENFFAYNVGYRNGVSLAVCDLDGGKSEIIVIPRKDATAHMRIFGYRDGVYRPVILGLWAYSQNFRGGVTLGCGDTNANGKSEIITGPAYLGSPHVRIFGHNSRTGTIGILSSGFWAFNTDFRGGISVATGDFDYDYEQEIVTAVAAQDRAIIRIYYPDGTLMKEFVAYPENYINGINIATGKF